MSERKFRHETKHELRYIEYLAIRSRLLHIAKRDRNAKDTGTYFIRSLYFDNYQDKVLREKIDGINEREKFRIRYYNGDPSIIHLEKKSKINGLCNKQSTRILKEQTERLLLGFPEALLENDNALMTELYIKMKSQMLRPRVIVDYTREPFIYQPGNVRITFDRDIRTGLYGTDFFVRACPTLQAKADETVLMEVKYDEFLPEIIHMCIQENERKGAAFSKYAVCRRFG